MKIDDEGYLVVPWYVRSLMIIFAVVAMAQVCMLAYRFWMHLP